MVDIRVVSALTFFTVIRSLLERCRLVDSRVVTALTLFQCDYILECILLFSCRMLGIHSEYPLSCPFSGRLQLSLVLYLEN